MPSVECYSVVIDPIQHLYLYQDKMVVHSHDNLFLSRVLPSSLEDAAYDWFYSLPRYSLRSFKVVKQDFFHQYASQHVAQEEQKSPPHNQDEARRKPQILYQLFF